MVEKRYFSTPDGASNCWKNNEKSEFQIIINGTSVFGYLLTKKLFFAFNTFQVFGTT